MRILILGAGGVGGYFGARLVQAGADVEFLVRPPRARQLAEQGLRLESPLGNAGVPVVSVTQAETAHKPDIVLLTCKAYDLAAAFEAVAPAVANGTVVIPLLNGVAHMECVAQRFPAASVWGGIAHLGVTMTPDGGIRHLNQLNTIMFGPLDGRATERAEAFRQLFAGTPVDAQARPQIQQDLWDKFVFLATLAGITCLMRADIGTIVATDAGERLVLQLLGECERVAAKEGFAPNLEQLGRYRAQLTQKESRLAASMLRDIDRSGPTEADHVLGDMVRRAKVHDCPVPLLEIALTHLQAYEARRAATASR